MSLLWDTIKKIFSLFGNVINIGWQLIKFIFSKCWKFILLIGSLIIGIGAFKKASKED